MFRIVSTNTYIPSIVNSRYPLMTGIFACLFSLFNSIVHLCPHECLPAPLVRFTMEYAHVQ